MAPTITEDVLDAYEAFRAAAIDADDFPALHCKHAIFSLTDDGIRCLDCGVSPERARAYAAAWAEVEKMVPEQRR